MVLVAVGDEQTLDLILVLHHKGHVGDDHIDAEHIVVGENKAAVHDDDARKAALFIARSQQRAHRVFERLCLAARLDDRRGGDGAAPPRVRDGRNEQKDHRR